MQKILSGSARGRSLKPLPHSFPVRPILGRIKKSVFDILQRRLPESKFLDLYAGTGSVGMEALSRGACFCCFVEQDGRCIQLLNENLEILKFASLSKVVRADVLGNLSHLPGPFDIIFMGPPYVDRQKKPLALSTPTLEKIVQYSLLSAQGVIVSQRHKKEPLSPIPEQLNLFREEKYGDTLVAFLELKNQEHT